MDDLFVKGGESSEINVIDKVSGLTFLDLTSAPNPLITYQQLGGIDGQQALFSTFDVNTVTARFWLHFGTYEDFLLAKHDIHTIFSSRDVIRIRTGVQPALCYFVKSVPFEITPSEPGSHDAEFSIAFQNPSGYKYSLAKSNELPTGSDTALKELGMNLPLTETSYTFNTQSFNVYNPSDIVIDPYLQKHDLKIIIHASGNSIKVTNNTNGSTWSYNASLSNADTIILDGITTFKNGKPDSISTDYGNLTLEKGNNNISVSGATGINDITFSFRFIYID